MRRRRLGLGVSMGAWGILRAVWNGPFFIGELAQPVSVGDVLLKVLETLWRVLIAILGTTIAVVAAVVLWTAILSPKLFPPLKGQIEAVAVFDDGTLPPPIYISVAGTTQQPPPKPTHCTPDYPLKVTFYNRSKETVGSIGFELSAHLAGHTDDQIAYGRILESDRIIEPGTGWITCWAVPALKYNEEPGSLDWKAEVWSAAKA